MAPGPWLNATVHFFPFSHPGPGNPRPAPREASADPALGGTGAPTRLGLTRARPQAWNARGAYWGAQADSGPTRGRGAPGPGPGTRLRELPRQGDSETTQMVSRGKSVTRAGWDLENRRVGSRGTPGPRPSARMSTDVGTSPRVCLLVRVPTRDRQNPQRARSDCVVAHEQTSKLGFLCPRCSGP